MKISIQLDKRRSQTLDGWAIAFTMCANNVVVWHNALKKCKRSFAFIAQSQWHLSITIQESNNLRRHVRLQTLQKLVVLLVIFY
ncbi:hypothetical protein GS682_31445 [Nostoc sp. B(2019)]|nr:hypothetical protein [Nostoc sp. B(2019)]